MTGVQRRGVALATAGIAVMFGLAACSTVSVSSMRYVGAPAFAPTEPSWVELLRRPPGRPHERLGEVRVEPSGNPPVAEIEQAIRVEAAKLGADAAVLVYDRTRRVGTVVQGPWWGRTASPIYGRVIIAVAIRYK